MSWFSNMMMTINELAPLLIDNESREPFIYNLGDPQTSSVTPVHQDYNAIKQECLSSGRLFEDTIFSPRIAGAKSKSETCEWLRPREISEHPKFIADGVSRFDAVQGGVGDCWLVSSTSILASSKRLFQRVVPTDQSFDEGYCGLFRFRFWQYGKWIEVVIDDRLPTRNGELLFMRSQDPSEFWSPLLEKAYAKIHGSYQSLVGGTTSEALVDFTGGMTEYHDLQGSDVERPLDLFVIVKKAQERCSLMGASIEASSEADREAELNNGLVKGHAYSITNVTELSIGGRSIRMLRLRNPWSGESEWRGRWSDSSREWTMISEYERRRIGLTFDADGEFWMSCDDFEQNFTRVEICHLSPDSLDESQQRKWHTHMFEGKWIQGISAGGCRNNIESFATNPQYVVVLSDYEGTGQCDIIVSLMQKHRRSKYLMGSDQLTIGFAIYAIPDGVLMDQSPIGSSTPRYHQQVLSTEFFQYNKSVARTPTYINLREVTNRFTLKPGKYCVIPSTYEPNEGDSEFILRVWTEAPMSAAEMDVKPGLYPPYPSASHLTPSAPGPPPSGPSGANTPAYPPYPNPNPNPKMPMPTPAGGGGDYYPRTGGNTPSYPPMPMPDEPRVPHSLAPEPKPSPYKNFPDIEITPEVQALLTGVGSFLLQCIGNMLKEPTNSNISNRRTINENFSVSKSYGHNLYSPAPETRQQLSSYSLNGTRADDNNGTNGGKYTQNGDLVENGTANTNNNIEPQVVDHLLTKNGGNGGGKVNAEQVFSKIAGFDGYIDAGELQAVLNAAMKKEFGYSSFSLDTCRALIAAVDEQLIGKLGKSQFELLWTDVLNWARAFKSHDKDGNFAIDASELRAALQDAGIRASRNLLVAIIQRHGSVVRVKHHLSKASVGPKPGSGPQVKRTLSLDGFVHSCVKLMKTIKFWMQLQISQRVKCDNSFRERNHRAFRPDSPLSISSQHMNELYDDPGPDFVRIDLDTFLLQVMYS